MIMLDISKAVAVLERGKVLDNAKIRELYGEVPVDALIVAIQDHYAGSGFRLRTRKAFSLKEACSVKAWLVPQNTRLQALPQK